MTSAPKTENPTPDDELHIHLNLAGLAALMGTIEAAMTNGRSELRLGWSGVTVTCGDSADGLHTLTLTWRSDRDDDGEREPDPLPRTRVLETQG